MARAANTITFAEALHEEPRHRPTNKLTWSSKVPKTMDLVPNKWQRIHYVGYFGGLGNCVIIRTPERPSLVNPRFGNPELSSICAFLVDGELPRIRGPYIQSRKGLMIRTPTRRTPNL